MIKMKLHKKTAIVFTYIAICIAISGYLYPDLNTYTRVNGNLIPYETIDNFKNSLIIEGVGLFLLLGWLSYKGNKEDK